MRKHFGIATESQFSAEVISMEEEAVILDETNQVSSEVSSDLNEAERIIEVSDALEDLAVIADGIDEATPAEAALVEVAGDMAVAGTDIPAEEVVPAMESFVGKKISTEGIREVARTIWENIKKFLKDIWTKIEAYFYKIFGTIPRLRKNIEALKQRAEKVADEGMHPGKEKIKISSGVAALSVNYVGLKTEGEISKGLKDLETVGEYVYGKYVTYIATKGEKIADAISDFDSAAPQAAAKALADELSKDTPQGFPGTVITATNYPDYKVVESVPLMGNVNLHLRYVATGKGKDHVLMTLDQQRSTRCELNITGNKAKEVKDYEMMPLSTTSVVKLLEDAEKLIDTLEDYKRGSKAKDIQKARKSIESASDKAEKTVQSAKDDTDASTKAASQEIVTYYKAMLNFNAAYVRWAQSPAMPFFSHALSSIRGIVMVCEKSLSAHTKD